MMIDAPSSAHPFLIAKEDQVTTSSHYAVLCMFLLVGAGVASVQGCGGSSPGTGPSEGGLQAGDGGYAPFGSGGAQGGGGIVGTGGGIVGTGGVVPSGSGGMVGTGGGDAAALGGSGGSAGPTCGEPGLQCCNGNSCNGAGCCVSGICMAAGGTCVGLGGGTCNAGACGTCGGPGLPCCGTNPSTGVCTAPATKCNAGTCTKCGDLGSPCCVSASGGTATCNSTKAICNNNVCVACGVPGSPCCPGSLCDGTGCCYNNTCAAEATACGTSGGTCQAGRCSACGSVTQPCCSTNLCYDGLLCKGGACNPCGGVGQACCPSGGAAAPCQTGTTCSGSGADAVCARCGGLGDVCCAGNTCSDGCCSSGGRCLTIGSPTCPSVSPDGGSQPDAPIGGSGGSGGTGGAGGTTPTGSGGAGGLGGSSTTPPTGGAGGTTTPWTTPPGCGDGVVVSPERCDDGNIVPFDGCSSDCQNEPICNTAGPCTSKCGDGIVLGEDCDDGNTVDGDGCSSACKVEPGFACAQPDLGNPLLVPVVYRDFKFHKPTDFEASVTGSKAASTGMVNLDLDSDGKPVFTGLTAGGVNVASTTTFAQWYRNTDGVNHPTPSKLALWDNGNGAYVNRHYANGQQWSVTENAVWCGSVGYELLDTNGVAIPCTYQYSGSTVQTDCDKALAKGEQLLKCNVSSGSYSGVFLVKGIDGDPFFFPVDGDSFTPSSERLGAQIPPLYDPSSSWAFDVDDTGAKRLHNFSFTSEVRYWFKYQADQTYTLDITGDDDVWVFINKKLAVDLGGVHTPVEGSVTLDSTTATKLGLTTGNVYEVAVFQAERQSTSSTFKITLSGFNTAPSACHPK